MSKCKFKVGDYIICKVSDFWHIHKGWIGQVKDILPTGKITVVGKGCVITTDKVNCFDLYIKDQPTKIVITTDGKTTTAKMYRDKTLVKVETAKCHPDDRFDFMVGAKVAFDRLVGEKKEEPKYYNGKVVCVDKPNMCGCYTVGKIYQIVDGVMRDDYGDPKGDLVRSFDEWQRFSQSKWLEVVE